MATMIVDDTGENAAFRFEHMPLPPKWAQSDCVTGSTWYDLQSGSLARNTYHLPASSFDDQWHGSDWCTHVGAVL